MRPFGLGSIPTKSNAISDTPPADDTDSGKPEPKLGDPGPDKDSPITLSAEDVKAAGLDDIQSGDTFTVEVTCMATKVNDDGSIEAQVTDASSGEEDSEEDGGDSTGEDEEYSKPKGKIEMSPKDGGMKL